MFDLSLSEIIIIVVITLIVVKPEDVPGIMRSLGKALGKVKEMAREFTSAISDVSKDTGLSEVKSELREVVDLEGNIREAYDVSEIEKLIKDDQAPEKE